MSKSNLVWAALVVALMLACSSEDEGIGLPDPSSGRGNEPEKVASAEEVAEQKRGEVDCPAESARALYQYEEVVSTVGEKAVDQIGRAHV